MEQYSIFAKYYDEFMRDIPYDSWCEFILNELEKNNKKSGRILELGCGTGNMSFRMEKAGYEVVSTDLSLPMLKVANRKKRKNKSKIRFGMMDMCDILIDETFDIVLCLCDSTNYMQNEAMLEQVFAGVYNVLCPGGIYIFDLKKEDFFRQLADNTFVDEIDNCYYVWENNYDEENRDNYYYLTFFAKGPFGAYRKYEEEQMQHAFSNEEVLMAAQKTGLAVKSILELEGSEERIYYVMEKKYE